MTNELVVDKKRNIIFDRGTGMAELFEHVSINGEDSRLVKPAAVEYAMSVSDDGEGDHIVPEIICMVEGRSHNDRYYSADSMKSRKKNPQGTPGGAASFTVPVERPMLVNHDVYSVIPPFESIAIGYIESSKFISAKGGEPAQIRIWPRIVDAAAVRMIRDGRLKSVSVRAKTDKLICSICGKDVLAQYRDITSKEDEDDEPCTHWPGNTYDGKPCFFYTGTLWFQEVSFVTIPGVDQARVVDTNVDEDDKSGTKVAKEYGIEHWLPNISIVEEEELVSLALGVISEAHPENTPTEEAASEDEEISEWAQELEGMLVEELDAEGYYQEDHAVYQITSEKKLSTKARKKLKASTFCGPNRSFPVPDCAHVTAALRLLGRYKGPGDKSKIRACVMRKAKAMKCKVATDKKKEEAPNNLVIQEIQDNHDRIHEEYRALKESGSMTSAKRQALVGRHMQVSESLYALTREPHSAEDELDSATWSFLNEE